MFKHEGGPWPQYRSLPGLRELDFHRAGERTDLAHYEKMDAIHDEVILALDAAQRDGVKFLMFRHGWSTSGPFKTSARSVIRKIMRGTESTPYISRKDCIQHESVFVAAIRPPP